MTDIPRYGTLNDPYSIWTIQACRNNKCIVGMLSIVGGAVKLHTYHSVDEGEAK